MKRHRWRSVGDGYLPKKAFNTSGDQRGIGVDSGGPISIPRDLVGVRSFVNGVVEYDDHRQAAVNVSGFSNNIEHFVVRDASFCPIRDLLPFGMTTITTFVTRTILRHPNCELLLQNLSDLYVLVGHYSSNALVRQNEQTWEKLLTEPDAVDMEKNGHLVIGWMFMEKSMPGGVWPIWFVDTLVPSLGLTNQMMFRIQKLSSNQYVVPGEILPSATVYWVRWFLNHPVVERRNMQQESTEGTETITLGELFELKNSTIDWRHWTVTYTKIESDPDNPEEIIDIVLDDGEVRYRLGLGNHSMYHSMPSLQTSRHVPLHAITPGITPGITPVITPVITP